MSQEKTVDIRLAKIQKYCVDHHIKLGLEFDHVDETWIGWDDQVQLTDACGSLGELAEALEAEFQL